MTRQWGRVLFFICMLSALTSVARASDDMSPSRTVEIRAVWMDRNSIPKTEDGMRDMIRSYARAGINMIHPEVIFNGYSAYPSSYLKQKDLWNGVDMLGVITDESHKNGIEVHPWVWVFRAGYTADKGGILPDHPDWAMLDKDGKDATSNGSYWVSPARKSVRHLLLRAYEELVQKYPVDGIELDYVRYPSTDYGYEPFAREMFKGEHGIDPLDIEPLTRPVAEWFLWREELVNSFVKEVSETLRQIRPELQISAAVASYPASARKEYLQDWCHWSANKWVDFLAPMDYTANEREFTKRVLNTLEGVGDTALIAPGIGLLEFKGSEPMLKEIDCARAASAHGVTLFASAYLDKDRLKALQNGPFREKAELPIRDPLSASVRLKRSSEQRLLSESSVEVFAAVADAKTAKSLADYDGYRKREVGYVASTPPPLFIPDRVEPIPEARMTMTTIPPIVDGKLDDAAWQTAVKVGMDYNVMGKPVGQKTEVYATYDAKNLYIAYRAHEDRMADIKAKITEHDGAVFYEDSAELFLDAGKQQEYYHFAMNTIGTKYESRGYDVSFNPEWQCAAAKESDAWTAEMAIPLSALKLGTPTAGTVWRVNFCRERAVATEGPNAENMCWSPTYGSFNTPERFGRLIFGEEVK